MRKHFCKLIFCLVPFLSNAQTSMDLAPVYDTVQVYKCTYSIIREGSETTYKIDDKVVTKEEAEKVLKGMREQKKCNPCVMKRLYLDGTLESQGVFYYTCPGFDEKTETRKKGKNSEKVYIHTNSCNDGEWLFYSKDGKLQEVKYFDHGQEMKNKSRIVQ